MPETSTSMKKLDNVPLAERAREAILDAILEGRFRERLPSEQVLAEMLNVSRTTIRTALQSLQQDGILDRRRAIGTRINSHVGHATLALHRMIGFDRLLEEKGHNVEVEIDWRRDTPDADLIDAFGLEPDEDSLVTEKSYLADGALAIFVRDAIPYVNLSSDDFSGEVPASIFEFSDHEFKNPVDHVVAEIMPVVSKDENITRLVLEPGVAFTRLHERHYAKDGQLVAVSVVDVDNDYFHFEVFRRR